MKKQLACLALTMFALVGMPAAELLAQTENWRTYANPRFGTRADYPAHLFTDAAPPPANGDGQTFTTADGKAKLSIYGSFNATDETPRSYVENYIRPDGKLAYELIRDTYFVASAERGGRIHYMRCNFTRGDPGIIRCFAIDYPAAEKQRWDAIVKRIASSLR